jgi:hypothetical protein
MIGLAALLADYPEPWGTASGPTRETSLNQRRTSRMEEGYPLPLLPTTQSNFPRGRDVRHLHGLLRGRDVHDLHGLLC